MGDPGKGATFYLFFDFSKNDHPRIDELKFFKFQARLIVPSTDQNSASET